MSSLLEDGLNGKMMDAPKEVTGPRIVVIVSMMIGGAAGSIVMLSETYREAKMLK